MKSPQRKAAFPARSHNLAKENTSALHQPRAPVSEGADRRGGRRQSPSGNHHSLPFIRSLPHLDADIPLPALPGPEGIVLLDFAPI